MQLTNICRDVGTDWKMNRVYLPATEMAQFGVSEDDLAAGRVTDNFRRLMQFSLERARKFYADAEPGIRLLEDDGSQFTVWLMRMVYSGINEEIERVGYDVFRHRAATSSWRKLALAAEAWRRLRRARRATPAAISAA
jgi:phytoene synthase